MPCSKAWHTHSNKTQKYLQWQLPMMGQMNGRGWDMCTRRARACTTVNHWCTAEVLLQDLCIRQPFCGSAI